MTPEERARAGAAVSARMAELQLNAVDLQQSANVDNKTLASLLQGTRWSTAKVRGRVEAALGWAPGEIERAARGATVGQPSVEDLSDGQLIAELARRLGSASSRAPKAVPDQPLANVLSHRSLHVNAADAARIPEGPWAALERTEERQMTEDYTDELPE